MLWRRLRMSTFRSSSMIYSSVKHIFISNLLRLGFDTKLLPYPIEGHGVIGSK